MKEEYSILWWKILSAISVLNILFISCYSLTVKNVNTVQKILIAFSFIYTIVCAVRSFWLRKDVEQVCFFDVGISTPYVGRSLATIAELCYILIIIIVFCYIILYISKIANKNLHVLFWLVKITFPIIIIAEIFSWLGCISKYYLWNAAEESLWMISACIFILVAFILYSNILNIKQSIATQSITRLLAIFVICATIFVIFMIITDIPMYYKRWKKGIKQDEEIYFWKDFKGQNKQKLTKENIVNLNRCVEISKDFNIWKDEIAWLTGYFTFGVWSSFALVIWYINFTRIKNK